jgi:hypothetical protein
MNFEKTIPAAIAAAAFAFLGQVASAEPVFQGSAAAGRELAAEPQSSLTLVRTGQRGARGTRAGRPRGVRAGGPRRAAVRGGPRRAAVRGVGPRRAFVGGPRAARRRFAGSRRGRFWRHGRWYGPAIGVGIGGGSCYWNCRNAGHGRGFCRANAGRFC